MSRKYKRGPEVKFADLKVGNMYYIGGRSTPSLLAYRSKFAEEVVFDSEDGGLCNRAGLQVCYQRNDDIVFFEAIAKETWL